MFPRESQVGCQYRPRGTTEAQACLLAEEVATAKGFRCIDVNHGVGLEREIRRPTGAQSVDEPRLRYWLEDEATFLVYRDYAG